MQLLYAILIAILLVCSYYLYIEAHNIKLCNKMLSRHKVSNIKLPSGSILLFSNHFAMSGQQLFYSYANSCFTHIALVIEIEGKSFVLEINPRDNYTWIPDSILPVHLNNTDSDITLSYLHERLKLHNGFVFAHVVNKKPKRQPSTARIRHYMETIQYYKGHNLLSIFMKWRRHCGQSIIENKLQQTCVDFTYYVLIDMGLLPSGAKLSCQLPHEVSNVIAEDGQRLFGPPIRLT